MTNDSETLDEDTATLIIYAIPVAFLFAWLAVRGAWNDWRSPRE